MKHTNGVEYAIHGLAYMAKAPGRTVLLRDAAEAIRVPESYLRKVFQALTRGGIVRSQRGARGGYALTRDPTEITLRQVVEAVEGPAVEYFCLREERGCGLHRRCLVRRTFLEAATRMAEVLDGVSVEDIAHDAALPVGGAPWMAAAVT